MEWTPFLASKYTRLYSTRQKLDTFVCERDVGMSVTTRILYENGRRCQSIVPSASYERAGDFDYHPFSRQELRYMVGLFGELCQALLFEVFTQRPVDIGVAPGCALGHQGEALLRERGYDDADGIGGGLA